MRVGLYFHGYVPESGGGFTFEQELLTSLDMLAEKSHHEFIVFLNNTATPPKYGSGNSKNLKYVFLDKPKPPTLLERIAKTLGRGIKTESPFQKAIVKEQIEFVWFPTPLYNSVDVPYIATIWDIQHRVQPWFPEVGRSGNWASRESSFAPYLQRAAYIVAPNKAGMKELSFFYQIPEERIRLLAHPTPKVVPLPGAEEVEAVLRKYNVPKDYLFYPAQFHAHKNHANLLLAIKSLRDQYKLTLHLVLAGSDKGNLEHIQNLASQSGIKELVHFIGFVPREDLVALTCGALALVYVSLFGPENMPPLEAFACGCPVIAANVAGAEEQMGDAAMLVNGLNPNEIALAIKKIRDDQQYRESLIQKGHNRASRFTGLDFVKGVFAMLDEFEPIRRNWK